jgi:hypothetical protein
MNIYSTRNNNQIPFETCIFLFAFKTVSDFFQVITEKYISGLIALINEHIENMEASEQRSEVKEGGCMMHYAPLRSLPVFNTSVKSLSSAACS